MNEKCTIFVGGEPVGFKTLDMDHIVHSRVYGADKGYYLAQKLGISCDVVIGDFDSSKKPDRDDVILHPVEKDDTDLMLAIKHAFENGASDFQIYGAMGARADHLFGNIQALAYIVSHGGTAVMIGDKDRAMLLPAGKYHLPKRKGYSLSLFSYSEQVGHLFVDGTKYPAADITLTQSFPLAMSNHIESDNGADIAFSSGLLLVIESER